MEGCAWWVEADAARIQEMKLARGRRAGEELLRAHPKSRLAVDLSSGQDTMRAGGWCAVQRAVLRKQWDLLVWSSGEKPGLDRVGWKTTVGWVLEATKCGCIHPGKVRGEPGGARPLKEEDPKGDTEAEREQEQVKDV